MAERVVIFGAGDIADVAYFYLKHDSPYEVVAFAVDKEYIKQDTFNSLPVVAFEDAAAKYPPSEYKMFVALSYAKVNSVRESKCSEARARGYSLISYVSTKATVWPDLTIGDNCFILEDNTIQPFVRIGNNVTLWSGNHIGHHSRIADNCFISSHVVISGGVEVGQNCFIGVNATLRDHIKVAPRCVIGAGATILADTQESGVYMASPTEVSRVPSNRLRGI